jgi:hypothetical protein
LSALDIKKSGYIEDNGKRGMNAITFCMQQFKRTSILMFIFNSRVVYNTIMSVADVKEHGQ